MRLCVQCLCGCRLAEVQLHVECRHGLMIVGTLKSQWLVIAACLSIGFVSRGISVSVDDVVRLLDAQSHKHFHILVDSICSIVENVGLQCQ